MSKAKQTALAAADAALSKGGLEPILLDVSSSSSYTDFILVVSARNKRQCQAIAEKVEAQLKVGGREPIGIEGDGEAQWRLLDFGDVVVHVFDHPARLYYDLEGLWTEAPRVKLNVPVEQKVSSEYYY